MRLPPALTVALSVALLEPTSEKDSLSTVGAAANAAALPNTHTAQDTQNPVKTPNQSPRPRALIIPSPLVSLFLLGVLSLLRSLVRLGAASDADGGGLVDFRAVLGDEIIGHRERGRDRLLDVARDRLATAMDLDRNLLLDRLRRGLRAQVAVGR